MSSPFRNPRTKVVQYKALVHLLFAIEPWVIARECLPTGGTRISFRYGVGGLSTKCSTTPSRVLGYLDWLVSHGYAYDLTKVRGLVTLTILPVTGINGSQP